VVAAASMLLVPRGRDRLLRSDPTFIVPFMVVLCVFVLYVQSKAFSGVIGELGVPSGGRPPRCSCSDSLPRCCLGCAGSGDSVGRGVRPWNAISTAGRRGRGSARPLWRDWTSPTKRTGLCCPPGCVAPTWAGREAHGERRAAERRDVGS
jgi:hypothetical protein